MHGLKFGAVLDALERRSNHQKAAALRRLVTERFAGVASEKELLKLPVEDLVGMLDLFGKLFTELQNSASKGSTLEKRVKNLKQKGFCVVYGAKYA